MTEESSKKSEKQRSERAACENCRQSHSACSRSGPPCFRCSRTTHLNSPCSYESRSHTPKPKVRHYSRETSPHLLLSPLHSDRKTRAQSGTNSNNERTPRRNSNRKNLNEESEDEDDQEDEDEEVEQSKRKKPTNRRLSLGSPGHRKSPGRPRKVHDDEEEDVYSGEVGDAFYILGWKVNKIKKKEYPPLPKGSATSIPVINPEDGLEIVNEVQEEATSCGLSDEERYQLWFQFYQRSHAIHDDIPKAVVIQVPEDSEEILNAQGQWKRPASYIIYREKDFEEQDALVEYDIDSEDEEWLNEINSERDEESETIITEDQFETMIDRLEKESFAQESLREPLPEEEIDILDTNCCICDDGTSEDTNQIVFCDGCDIGVHQECYGIRYIPEGRWFCQKCQSQHEEEEKGNTIRCVFCPNFGGAFRKTDSGEWGHVVCALWIPETNFHYTMEDMRGDIVGVDLVNKARLKLTCYLCNRKKEGACIQCCERTCALAYHVTCAQAANLSMIQGEENSNKKVNSTMSTFCAKHSSGYKLDNARWDRFLERNGQHGLPTATPRKRGRKPKNPIVNSPNDSNLEDKSDVERHSNSNSSPQTPSFTPNKRGKRKRKGEKENEGSSKKKTKFLDLIAHGTVSLETALEAFPDCPKSMVEEVHAYWMKKRASRSGNPLIKKFNKSILFSPHYTPKKMQKGDYQNSLSSMKSLRKDLEKCRLLLELCQKRESNKKQRIIYIRDAFNLQTNPLISNLSLVLDFFREQDVKSFFSGGQNSDSSSKDLKGLRIKNDEGQFKEEEPFWKDLGSIFMASLYMEGVSEEMKEEGRRLLTLVDDFVSELKELDRDEVESDRNEELKREKKQYLINLKKEKAQKFKEEALRRAEESQKRKEEDENRKKREEERIKRELERRLKEEEMRKKEEEKRAAKIKSPDRLKTPKKEGKSPSKSVGKSPKSSENTPIKSPKEKKSPGRKPSPNSKAETPIKTETRGRKKKSEATPKKEKQKEEKEEKENSRTTPKKRGNLEDELNEILDVVEELDKHSYFLDPVDLDETPEYKKIVERPICITEMRKKVKSGKYTNLQGLRDDIRLMCRNATDFNEHNSDIFHTAKTILWKSKKYIEKKVDPFPSSSKVLAQERELTGACVVCGELDEEKEKNTTECSGCRSWGHNECLEGEDLSLWFCYRCDPAEQCHTCMEDISKVRDEDTLHCAGCSKGYHKNCLDLTGRKPRKGFIFCQECDTERGIAPVTAKKRKAPKHMKEEKVEKTKAKATPKKQKVVEIKEIEVEQSEEEVEVKPKKRGRPRKIPEPEPESIKED